ncbi:MAG: hypothetical protein ABMB14_18020 [Myxococcota bacterium]
MDPTVPAEAEWIALDRDRRRSMRDGRWGGIGAAAGAVTMAAWFALALVEPIAPLVMPAYAVAMAVVAIPLAYRYLTIPDAKDENGAEATARGLETLAELEFYRRSMLPLWPMLIGYELGVWLAAAVAGAGRSPAGGGDGRG